MTLVTIRKSLDVGFTSPNLHPNFIVRQIFCMGLAMLAAVTMIAPTAHAYEKKTSFAIYGGPGTPSPLLDLIRFRTPSFENLWNVTIAVNRELVNVSDVIDLEAEASFSQHLENIQMNAVQGAGVLRWLPLPWDKVIEGSAAVGLGLSYAQLPPLLESTHLGRTSNMLFHFYLEYAVMLGKEGTWEGLFRIHHRSGMFGVFDGVVGGSDFLCLGARYRL